jgi:hypothetical protein
MSLKEIENLTKEYALARKTLSDRVQELEEELTQIKKRHLTGIKKAVAVAATWQSNLNAAIDAAPELFQKPRTVVFYGIKVGMQKQKGKIEWEDDEYVIERLKKLFPDNWEDYVKITAKPVKAALENLSVSDLKRLGVTAEESGDKVLIKPTDSEVDKLVEALLRDEIKEAA